MAIQFSVAGLRFCAGLCLAAVALPGALGRAQNVLPFGPLVQQPLRERALSGHIPDKPSQPPVLAIPVGPLGFAAPGPYYLGARVTLASLDFIGEDRLLFTFRVPGLLHRDVPEGDTRSIRAVLLHLPAGAVEEETLWTVHDNARYLWMLNDGRFLVRDRDTLFEGGASLVLKPFLQFPGPLQWMDLDPRQQFLATNSREPVKTRPEAAAASGDSGSPPAVTPPDNVVRILRRASGDVLLVSRTRQVLHVPINSEGYLEALRGQGDAWLLDLSIFTGGSRVVGRVDSVCTPLLHFVADREVLATACSPVGGDRLVALDLDGRGLWADLIPASEIWPQLVISAGGLRFARETLAVSHPVNAFSPLNTSDIKSQVVRVFDAASGDVALETVASPILDVGGNVALSPSGRRLAVLNAGSIQIFDLPAPAPAAPGNRIR